MGEFYLDLSRAQSELKIQLFNTNHNQIYSVGADSLEYLSVQGLIKAVRSDIKTKNSYNVGHCTACLTGQYPGGIPNGLEW